MKDYFKLTRVNGRPMFMCNHCTGMGCGFEDEEVMKEHIKRMHNNK